MDTVVGKVGKDWEREKSGSPENKWVEARGEAVWGKRGFEVGW